VTTALPKIFSCLTDLQEIHMLLEYLSFVQLT